MGQASVKQRTEQQSDRLNRASLSSISTSSSTYSIGSSSSVSLKSLCEDEDLFLQVANGYTEQFSMGYYRVFYDYTDLMMSEDDKQMFDTKKKLDTLIRMYEVLGERTLDPYKKGEIHAFRTIRDILTKKNQNQQRQRMSISYAT